MIGRIRLELTFFFFVGNINNQCMLLSHIMCRNEAHEVIKYLEFCVHRLQNEDPGVHNLLLSLYAKQVELFTR